MFQWGQGEGLCQSSIGRLDGDVVDASPPPQILAKKNVQWNAYPDIKPESIRRRTTDILPNVAPRTWPVGENSRRTLKVYFPGTV